MPPPPTTSPGGSSQRHNSTSTPSPNDEPPPSSASRRSKDSEGYPSWLPKRPPPPAPASTLHSSIFAGYFDDDRHDPRRRSIGDSPNTASPDDPHHPNVVGIVGRKPTPRSVRIVSVQDRPPAHVVGAVEGSSNNKVDSSAGAGGVGVGAATKHGRNRSSVNPPAKVMTRPTSVPGPSSPNPVPDLIGFTSSAAYPDHSGILTPNALPHPRFNAKNLQLGLLRNPSKWMKFYYYIWPLLVFYHIPAQTFLDFNAVYMLLLVAKFPNPNTTSKNWALGAAAYVACWLVWILVVCVLYELVYSFARRWRMRRPLILPIYLSSAAFNFAAMTSYTNFSFLMYLRFSAFWNALSEPVVPPPSSSRKNKSPREMKTTSTSPRKQGKDAQRTEAHPLGEGAIIDLREEEFGVLTEKRDRDQAAARHQQYPGSGSGPDHEVDDHHHHQNPEDDDDNDNDNDNESTDSSEDEQHEWTWISAFSETFYFYSQNLPTVALLLPRAGLALALIFAFSDAAPVPMLGFGVSPSVVAGMERWMNRDRTFFGADGALTGYAKVVLWLNVAWAVWKAVVLLIAWSGLWILSNQRLAGLSGPRHIWEETANEKRRSRYAYSSAEAEAEWRASLYAPHGPHRPLSQAYSSHHHPSQQARSASAMYEEAEDDIPWEWRDATRMRVQDAFMFCLVLPRRSSNSRSRSRSRFGSRRMGTGAFTAASLRGDPMTGGDLRWSSVSGEAVRIVNTNSSSGARVEGNDNDDDDHRGRDAYGSGFEFGYGYGWMGEDPDQPGPYAYGGYGPNSRRFKREKELRKSGESNRERYLRGGRSAEGSARDVHDKEKSAVMMKKTPTRISARDVEAGGGSGGTGEGMEGLERVIAAAVAGGVSPSKRGALTRDLFNEPSTSGKQKEKERMIEPLKFGDSVQPPHKVKRNSKDRISGVEGGSVVAMPATTTTTGATTNKPNAPLLALPYPFSRPGVGQVSSKDLVPFPASSPAPGSKKSGKSQKSRKSGTRTPGSKKSVTSVSGSEVTGSHSGTGTGSELDAEGSEEVDDDDDEEEEEEEEDDDDDEEEEELDDEHDFMSSEAHSPSSGRASGSMSSLGQPIPGTAGRYAFSVSRRPVGVGHGRSMSGVSSGLSQSYSHSQSQSHSHSHSQSISSHGTRSGAMSVLTQSTGNVESTDSEEAHNSGRERASLSLGSSQSGHGSGVHGVPSAAVVRPPRTHMGALAGLAAGALPLPPRHPGEGSRAGRGRSRSMASVPSSSGNSTSSAAAAAALASVHPHMTMNIAPIAFPSVVHVHPNQRRRADSGMMGGQQHGGGVVVDPSYVYGETMSDVEVDSAEVDRGEEEDDEELEGEEGYEHHEHDDQIGLLGVPHTPSPRGSLLGGLGLGNRSRRSSAVSHSNDEEEGYARSRSQSHSSRSRRSSGIRSRTQSYSSHGSGSPRERASSLVSLGSSMRAFVQGSMSQIDLVMRGATGPAAGLGSFGVSGGGSTGLGGGSSNVATTSGSRSRPRSRVNSSMDRVDEEVAIPPLPLSPLGPSTLIAAGQRNRDTSGGSSNSASGGENGGSGGSMSGRSHALEAVPMNPLVRRTRNMDLEMGGGEGYASSAGTHSRSGSESVGGASVENWTFGRPIVYRPMDPGEDHAAAAIQGRQQLETQQEEDEALAERSREPSRRASPDHDPATAGSAPIAIPGSLRQPANVPQSVSASMTESFYSAQTAGQPGEYPIEHSPNQSQSPSPPRSNDSHSPERQGVDVPWSPQGFLAPPSAWNSRGGPSGRQTGAINSNPSIDMLSTAAGSFVTAPATIADSTTATEGSGGMHGQNTPRLGSSVGSWDTSRAAEGVISAGRRVDNIGGMVERPGDDMGATGGAWRVM